MSFVSLIATVADLAALRPFVPATRSLTPSCPASTRSLEMHAGHKHGRRGGEGGEQKVSSNRSTVRGRFRPPWHRRSISAHARPTGSDRRTTPLPRGKNRRDELDPLSADGGRVVLFSLLTSLTRTRRPRTRCSGMDGSTCAVKRRALTMGGWGSGSGVSPPELCPVEETSAPTLHPHPDLPR